MIADPVATVHALAVDAELALLASKFDEFAPRLRQALAACPPDRRPDVVLSLPLVEALALPALERMPLEEFYAHRDTFLAAAGGDMARAWAEFVFACAAGEVGFNG
jgi:hypothetical protein